MSSLPKVAQRSTATSSAISSRSIHPASGAGGFCWMRSSGGAKSAGSALRTLSDGGFIASGELQHRERWVADQVSLRLHAEPGARDDALRSLERHARDRTVEPVEIREVATER